MFERDQFNMMNCMILQAVAALLKEHGVDDMKLEWNIKGQQAGEPITLTLRWTPEKTIKRKSPSTKKHERDRSRKYFEQREEQKNVKSMDKVDNFILKEEMDSYSDSDGGESIGSYETKECQPETVKEETFEMKEDSKEPERKRLKRVPEVKEPEKKEPDEKELQRETKKRQMDK